MKICSKGLLSLHMSKREKTGTEPADEAAKRNQETCEHREVQSATASVGLSGKDEPAGTEAGAETSDHTPTDEEINNTHDERPILRRETRSHRPVRRAPTRHSSMRAVAPSDPDDADGPARRPVLRQSSCRSMSAREDATAAPRRSSLTRRPSLARTSSSRGSAGSSRLAVVRRTSSRTLARDHASSRSLSSCSSHDGVRDAKAVSRPAPSRNFSNDTLPSVDSSIRTLPSSDDDDDESCAKYEYETMSGLEYGTAEAEPTVARRRHPQHIPGRPHPSRRPGGRGQPTRTASSSCPAIDGVRAAPHVTSHEVRAAESTRRSDRASRARRATPTAHKVRPASAARRRTSSGSDSHTCGSSSTDGSSPKGHGDPLGNCSFHESMSHVLSGLDELDSMLLGSSIHTTVSCAY